MSNKLILFKVPPNNKYTNRGKISIEDDLIVGNTYEYIGVMKSKNDFNGQAIIKIKLLPLNLDSVYDGLIFIDENIIDQYFKSIREYNLDILTKIV